MAYRRRYGRRVRRYRKGRTLSTRNIYLSKSSTSQAKQIAALKRRISKVSSRCRPETKMFETTPDTETFTSELSGTWCYKKEVLAALSSGTGDSQYVGDHVRSLKLQVPIHAEFAWIGASGETTINDSMGASLRVIVIQSKSRTNDGASTITPAGVVSNASGSGPGYELIPVAPLTRGITERFKILVDKTYRLTQDNNQLNTRIACRPDNIRIDANGNYNKIFLMIYASNLHWESASVYEQIRLTYQCKYIFSDA